MTSSLVLGRYFHSRIVCALRPAEAPFAYDAHLAAVDVLLARIAHVADVGHRGEPHRPNGIKR